MCWIFTFFNVCWHRLKHRGDSSYNFRELTCQSDSVWVVFNCLLIKSVFLYIFLFCTHWWWPWGSWSCRCWNTPEPRLWRTLWSVLGVSSSPAVKGEQEVNQWLVNHLPWNICTILRFIGYVAEDDWALCYHSVNFRMKHWWKVKVNPAD